MTSQRTTLILGGLVGVLICALAGLGWAYAQKPPPEELVLRADSIRTLRAEIADLEVRVAQSDSAAALANDSLEVLALETARIRQEAQATQEREEVRARQAGEEFHATMDSLRAVVAPEHVPLVDTAEAQADARNEAQEARIRSLEGELAAVDAELVGTHEVRVRQQAQIRERDQIIERQALTIETQARQIESLEGPEGLWGHLGANWKGYATVALIVIAL